MNLYSLWRMIETDQWELVALSTDRDEMRELMSEDAKGLMLPLQYKLSIERVSGDLTRDGRASAFRQAAEFFEKEADLFSVGTAAYIGFRRAAVKLFALMEQEMSK